MKRSVAKVAVVLVLWIIVVTICIALDQHFRSPWTPGLGGGFGYLTALGTSKLFDRIWPKPKDGWAE